MPSFFPHAMNGRLPHTPLYSDHYDALYHGDKHATQYHQSGRADSMNDYTHRFPPLGTTRHSACEQGRYNNLNGQLPPINSYYESMGAPTLPPLHPQDVNRNNSDCYHHSFAQTTARQPEQQQSMPQEEQTTGGVSAKLDYEMERMTDFVSEAAQGIILQANTSVHPAFRKWVLQVLSATRLPSATILLSLHYLTVRMREFPLSIERTDNQIYRLLCVSMILGSKFLDDNTFINRSWSDVSGIKVTELNDLEIRWLALIGFDLHADPKDSNGVALWLRAWQEFDTRETAKVRPRVTSPNTRNQGQNSLAQIGHTKTIRDAFGATAPALSTFATGSPYTSANPWNQYNNYSDPWTFQPRHLTADTYGRDFHYGSHSAGQAGAPTYTQFSLPPLQSLVPSFPLPWNQSSWEYHHGYGCHCGACPRQAGAYMMGNHFAPQTVVG